MRKLFILATASIGFVLVAFFWLRQPDSRGRPKLIVFAIDALDSRIVARLIAEGETPTLRALYEKGAVGTIRTSELGLPPVSPAIWTTFATGVLPDVHRIRGFVFKADQGWELFRSIDRTVPAFWEIVSQAGNSVGVVNWWFSYPPEQIRGFLVTDRYFEAELAGLSKVTLGQATGNDAPVTYPPELVRQLRIPRQLVLPKVISAKEADQLDGTMLELAFQAAGHIPVEILVIYLNGLDRVSHVSWDARDPDGMGGVEVRKHMHNLDRLLAKVLRWAGTDKQVVILSDHGFEAAPPGQKFRGIHESKEAADAAFILLAGPGIKGGTDLGVVSPLDILPTLLALAGVPLPEEIPGSILRQAFQPGACDFAALEKRQRYARLPAVEGQSRPRGVADDAVDQATKERLRALGYID